jgi:hypothetical protein
LLTGLALIVVGPDATAAGVEGQVAAIYRQQVPGDEGGRVGSEGDRRLGDVVGLTEPSQRDAGQQTVKGLVESGEGRFDLLGRSQVAADRPGAAAQGPDLTGGLFGPDRVDIAYEDVRAAGRQSQGDGVAIAAVRSRPGNLAVLRVFVMMFTLSRAVHHSP